MCKMLQINLECDTFSVLLLVTACACWNIKGPEKSCNGGSSLALFIWRIFF